MTDASNPLLDMVAADGPALPDFAALSPHHAEPAVDQLIEAARRAVAMPPEPPPMTIKS